MKKKNSILLGGICLVFFCITGVSGVAEETVRTGIEAHASVDKDTISIGDAIRYTITVKADKDIEVLLPEFSDNLAGFAVKDFGKKEKTFMGKRTYIRWFILDTYVTGEYPFPPAQVQYKYGNDEQWRELETNELAVTVESVLTDVAQQDDIRDIKGPIAGATDPRRFYGLAALVVLLLAGALGYGVYKRRTFHPYSPPPRPAHELAYEALEMLQSKQYIEHGRVKEFFSELSYIAREYIENRFHIRAPEMTTEEFLVSVRGSKVLNSAQKNVLKDFLEKSDMVKFAKYGPSHEECSISYEAAKHLVDETKVVEVVNGKDEDDGL